MNILYLLSEQSFAYLRFAFLVSGGDTPFVIFGREGVFSRTG